jgi:anti-sigma factor ChrR (cupin superfamily)
MTVLLRLVPGAQFPLHAHADRERVLLLEGGYRDDQSGAEFWRGELDVREAGTSHSFTALEGVPCLCASVAKLGEDA